MNIDTLSVTSHISDSTSVTISNRPIQTIKPLNTSNVIVESIPDKNDSPGANN